MGVPTTVSVTSRPCCSKKPPSSAVCSAIVWIPTGGRAMDTLESPDGAGGVSVGVGDAAGATVGLGVASAVGVAASPPHAVSTKDSKATAGQTT